jgi:uncharacterized membrane protein
MSILRKYMRKILEIFQFKKTLWRGLIIAAPILIIIWVFYEVLNAVNSLGDKLLATFVPDRYLIWGTGLLLILFFIFIIGRIEVHYEGREKSLSSVHSSPEATGRSLLTRISKR